MTRIPKPNSKDDAIDQLIEAHFHASADELAPSSGFVQSVMESIQAQAAEPPPIAFPWRRILPGSVAILCSALVFVVVFLRHGGHAPTLPVPSAAQLAHLTLAISLSPRDMTLCWIGVAACLSVAAIATSFHLTGRRE
jgi:hypothetical protein